MPFKKSVILVLFAVVLATGIGIQQVLAENRWFNFRSETGLFSVRIPNEYKVDLRQFRIGPDRILYSGETVATIDQRPYKKAVKNYIVKLDQTLGATLSEDEIDRLLDREFLLYTEHYRPVGGVLKKQIKELFEGHNGGEIYISYKDEDLGLQGIRARIIFTDATKFQQIITGPDHIMHSLKTRDFMESFYPKSGIPYSEGIFSQDWTSVTSPLAIFSVRTPPITPPYVGAEPVIQNTDKSEMVAITFTDPVRAQNIYYTVYGYRLNTSLSFAEAQQVLTKRHIAKHRKNMKGVKLRKNHVDDMPRLEAEYTIQPPKNFKYMNMVKSRTSFGGNYMIVQEIMGSQTLVRSDFAARIMELVEFHPKMAWEMHKRAQQIQAAPETPDETTEKQD